VQEVITASSRLEMTRDLIAGARQLGFDSHQCDLIYPPMQTAERFAHTVEQVVALAAGSRRYVQLRACPLAAQTARRLGNAFAEGMENLGSSAPASNTS